MNILDISKSFINKTFANQSVNATLIFSWGRRKIIWHRYTKLLFKCYLSNSEVIINPIKSDFL